MFEWLTWEHHPSSGFRFSTVDAIVLGVGLAGTVYLWEAVGTFGLVPAYLLGHFFLFCNVFRIRRSYELLWSGLFIANIVAWFEIAPSMTGPMVTQLAATGLLIALEMRSERYHGIFASGEPP